MQILSTILLALAGPGTGTSAWTSDVSEAIQRSEYRFRPVAAEPGVWSAPNRAQSLRSRVSPAGIEVFPRSIRADGRRAPWKLELATTSFGRFGDARTLGQPALRAEGARVELDHGLLLEWFENGCEGVEQGWTIRARPRGVEPVWIGLRIAGDLDLRIDDSARCAALVDPRGTVRLRYRDLLVFDATGRELRARIRQAPAPVQSGPSGPGDERGFGIEIDDTDAAYPLTVDPVLTGPTWTAEGDQASAWFGHSVTTAGDVNGDGYSDVIVGAPLFDGGESEEGRAFLFLGSATGLPSSPAWTAEGDQPGANFGLSVGTAGDVNDDGFSDVIVGAPEFDGGQVSEGRAYVYMGSASGLAASAAWTVESDVSFAAFGGCVATAGDVNGDGYSDVVVGASQLSNGQVTEGRAYLFLGSTTGLSTSSAWTVESDQVGAALGGSVGAAGDVDGDGFDDVIVGALSFDNSETDEGRAFLFLGSSTGLPPSPDWTAEGDQAGARFGNAVATAGDVNGDGYGDVVVGARTFDDGQPDEGLAFVYFGSPAGLLAFPDWTGAGDQASALFGYSVATAGDVNGDGYSDLLVGARAFDDTQTDEGRAFVYLGSPDGPSLTPAWTAESAQGGALFGISVAAAGDVDGDGYSDVIVGAGVYDDGQIDEGRAYVYLGSPVGLKTTSSWTAESDQPNAALGVSVAPAGDVNGDGYGDVIVGASSFDNGQIDEGRAFTFLGSATGLAASPAWTAEGNQGAAGFGGSVSTAGDVNGDGYGDAIVGAQSYDNGESNEGRAYVYLGSAAGLATSAAWIAESNQANAFFGISVSTAGDVNGDGYGDVIVGAQAFDNGQVNEGRAYVYHGSGTGLPASPSWTSESDQTSAFFGVPVATAGDVNGDGFSDVIVGAASFDNPESNEGRTFVYLGSASGLALSAAWTAESDQANAAFGSSAATAGDVNGDGYSDVIVGAPDYDDGEADEGRAYVYLGSASGLQSSSAWTVESDQAGARLGSSICAAGDVDGDGYGDVVVGASSHDDGQTDEGQASTFLGSASGLAASPAWTEAIDQASANFGTSVAGAGDVNGDGFADVLIGAPGFDHGQSNEGRAFLYLGKEGMGTWTHGAQQRQSSDAAPIALLGRSLSSSRFRIRLRADRGLAGFTWASPRTPDARLEWEIAPLLRPFGGTATDSGTPQTVTGAPLVFNELVEFFVPSAGNVQELPFGAFHWRVRLRTNNPVLPVTPWVSVGGNDSTETKLRRQPPRHKQPR